MVGKYSMQGRIIGKDSQYTFKLFGRLQGDGAIDDLFGNTDVLADIVFHEHCAFTRFLHPVR